jgi:replicative DNA helicase
MDLRTALPDSEYALLAACLRFGAPAYYEACEHITVDDLARPSHRAIWRAVGRIAEAGGRPDAPTVWEALGEDRSFLDDAGGPAYLVDISNTEIATKATATYAKQVRERSVHRQVHQILSDALTQMETDGLDVDVLQEQLFRVGETQQPAVTFQEAVQDVFLEADRPHETNLPFPWSDVQYWTRGMRAGGFYLLAGETGHGKTAAALTICRSLILHGRSVLYINLEMEPRELALRMGQMQGYNADHHYSGGEKDLKPLLELQTELGLAKRQSHIKHVDRVAQLPALIRRHRPDLVVVDHIGLLDGEGRSPYERVSGNSRGLKMLAKRYQLPVLCLCQLSRSHTGPGSPPTLERLRDSGRIGEDADAVLFVWRKRSEDQVLTDEGRFIVAKSRMGRTGAVQFVWDGAQQTFRIQDGRWSA